MSTFFKGGGAQKVVPCLKGGGGVQKVSDPRFSHFVAPPLPVINDQSLMIPGVSFGYSLIGIEFRQIYIIFR